MFMLRKGESFVQDYSFLYIFFSYKIVFKRSDKTNKSSGLRHTLLIVFCIRIYHVQKIVLLLEVFKGEIKQ